MTLLDELKAIRAREGYSNFDHAIKQLNRERLDSGATREKRKKFSKAMCQRLYDAQKGICPWCDTQLDIPARRNEVDHINPNAESGFNDWPNLQLLHAGCNRTKSSKSMYEQSKATGKTITQLLPERK